MKILTSILAVLFICLTTVFVWGKVLNQSLLGEGTIYFSEPYKSMLKKDGFSVLWQRHDAQALIFFEYARDYFKDNVTLYMWVLLAGTALVNVSLFFLIKGITKNAFAAIVGSTLLNANFVGSFEILGLGYYQWFIQRVPNFALGILSFIFLIKFFSKGKKAHYLISLIIYSLTVFLARYSIHILPLFVYYVFLNNLFHRKKFIKTIFAVLPFMLVSYLMIKAQTLVGGEGLVFFLKNSPKNLSAVLYQLTYLTFPFLQVSSKYFPFISVKSMILPTFFLYTLSVYFVSRKDKKIRPIILAVFLALPTSIFLSIFLNSYFISFFDTSRYLYFTAILFSLFWSLVFYHISQKKIIIRFLIIVFISFWFWFNYLRISSSFDNWQEKHIPVVKTLNYLRKNKNTIPVGSKIYLPKEFGNYGLIMLNYFYKDFNFEIWNN